MRPFVLKSFALLGLACGLDRNAPEDRLDNVIVVDGGGDDGSDPVAACQALENKLTSCGSMFEGTLSCAEYSGTACADFFDCLNDAYGQCRDGFFPDADPNALEDCGSLGAC